MASHFEDGIANVMENDQTRRDKLLSQNSQNELFFMPYDFLNCLLNFVLVNVFSDNIASQIHTYFIFALTFEVIFNTVVKNNDNEHCFAYYLSSYHYKILLYVVALCLRKKNNFYISFHLM